ncbi:hypothetical protein V1525DRAFT_429011 [Lipomyces kononenkoae]|uniref:Uncharacterized protein n=1 Tax=Lipomyces kononenkoae TaxID=34357 RepID=A0ACC3TC88_LIPKO
MFQSPATRIVINPRDYQTLPRPHAITSRVNSSTPDPFINPSYASTKDPIAIPPLPLYQPDGTVNHINHYYYYHHLSHFDRLDGAHRDLYDSDGTEIPHFHHPVSSVNLEVISDFGRHGITTRRNKGFRSVGRRSVKTAGKARMVPSPRMVSREVVDVLDPKQMRARPSPIERPETYDSAKDEGHDGFKRYFSFNWRVMLPKPRKLSQDILPAKPTTTNPGVIHSENPKTYCDLEDDDLQREIPTITSTAMDRLLGSNLNERIFTGDGFPLKIGRNATPNSSNLVSVPEPALVLNSPVAVRRLFSETITDEDFSPRC